MYIYILTLFLFDVSNVHEIVTVCLRNRQYKTVKIYSTAEMQPKYSRYTCRENVSLYIMEMTIRNSKYFIELSITILSRIGVEVASFNISFFR